MFHSTYFRNLVQVLQYLLREAYFSFFRFWCFLAFLIDKALTNSSTLFSVFLLLIYDIEAIIEKIPIPDITSTSKSRVTRNVLEKDRNISGKEIIIKKPAHIMTQAINSSAYKE